MILAIDIGNTRVKCAVIEGDIFLDIFVFGKEELQKNIQNCLKKYKKIDFLVVASVSDVEKQSFVSFEKEVNVHFISHKDPFPFTNCYATPQTLGIDRLVLASGASLQFPNQNRLVIDVGTCVTYDFIDENNNYLGGAISPGLRLRYEALHRFTAKLPLLSIDSSEQFIGKSTSESIHSGVINGLVYEIDGFIEEYRKRFTDVVVVLTGGDTELLSTRLKNDSFVNANFLLESLNYVFLYMMNHGLKK